MSKIKGFFENLVGNLTKKNHRGTKRTAFAVFAIAVVFCTVYALILPGVTIGNHPLVESEITNVKLYWTPAGTNIPRILSEESTVGMNDMLRFELSYALDVGTLSSSCDTVSYQLPSIFGHVTEVTNGVVRENGTQIGTYSISETGLVTITFFNTFVQRNATQGVVGNFSFKCKVGDVLTDGQSQTITIGSWSIKLNPSGGGGGGGGGDETTHASGGQTEPTTPPTPVVKDLSVFKDYDVIGDEINGIVDFTVFFMADAQTDEGPVLSEHMEGVSYYDNFRVRRVTIDEDFQIIEYGTDVAGTPKDLTPGCTTFTYECSERMAKDEVYVMTYRATVGHPFSGNYHAANTAAIESKIGGVTTKDNYRLEFYLFNRNTVKKSSAVVGDHVNWTITVHRDGGSDLSGWVLSDQLMGEAFEGDVSLSINKGETTTVQLPYTFPSGTEKADFVFTYSTPYQPLLGQAGVENKAIFHPSGYTGDKPITVTEKAGSNLVNNPLTKTDVGLEIAYDSDHNPLMVIDWNVDITPTLSDLVSGDGYDWEYDDVLKTGQYLTQEQADVVASRIATAMSSIGFTSADYTLQFKNTTDSTAPEGAYNDFVIHSYKTLPKNTTLTFSYTSQGPSGDLQKTHHYQNQGKVMQNTPGPDDYAATSQPEAVYYPVIHKTDAATASDNEITGHDYYAVNGKLSWDVEVCVPRGIETAATVTDTLPAGLIFDNLTMKINGRDTAFAVVWNDNTTKTSGTMDLGNGKTIAVTRTGQTLTMVLNATTVEAYRGDKVLHFYVATEVNQKPDYATEEDAPRFRNTASVSAVVDGEVETLGEDEQTQYVTVSKYHDVLRKSVVQTDEDKAGGRVPYHIEVNPEANDLLEGTDNLILNDTLSVYCKDKDTIMVYLSPESFKIYNYDSTAEDHKGTEIARDQYSYSYSTDYNTNTKHINDYVTIHIPDERALVIEYAYVIDTVLETVDLNISNVVKLEGVTETEVSSGREIEVEFDSTGASASTDGLVLYKVDSKNYGITLSGAHFKLYKYNDTDYEYVNEYVTGPDGTVLLSGLSDWYAYKLVETQAPTNYIADTTPYYFMLVGAMDTQHAPDGFNGELLRKGMSIYRPNTSNFTSINVKKRWVDQGSSSEVSHDGTILFNLYRKTGTRDPHVNLTATITKQVKNKDPVTLPFTPQTFQRGDTVEFVVTETRYRPGKDGVPNVTFYLNGAPHVVTPYWDPSQDQNDAATVTYTLTFRIEDDTHIVADLGELSNDPTIVARVSGTTPSESSSQSQSEPTESTATKYKITFKNGSTATLSNGDPFPSGGVDADTVVTLIPPTAEEGKRFSGWQIIQDNNGNPISASRLNGNNLTMPSCNVTVTALFEWIPHTVTVWNGLGTATPSSAGKDTTIQISAGTPAGGMEFSRWKVVNSLGEAISDDSVVFADANSATTTFSMPDHDVIVEPEYVTKTAHTIVVHDGTASVTSTGTPGTGKAYSGDSVTLTAATAPSGMVFDKWVIDDAPSGFTFDVNQASVTFLMPAGDVEVTATYKEEGDNLIVNGDFSDGTNGWSSGCTSFTASGEVATVQNGHNSSDKLGIYQSVDFVPGHHYTLTFDYTKTSGDMKLTLDGSTAQTYTLVSGNTYTCTFEATESMNQVQFAGSDAKFTLDNVKLVDNDATPATTYTITTQQPVSGGTFTASAASAEEGATVTLTPSPATGYTLDHWVVTDGDDTDITATVVSGNTLTMPEGDVTVTAVFKKQDYTVTIVNGKCGGATTTTMQMGDTIDVVADGSPQYQEFDKWTISGDGSGSFVNEGGTFQSATATFQMSNSNPGNVTLTANYKDILYLITFTNGGSASVNSEMVTAAAHNASVLLVPDPSSGHTVKSWTIVDSNNNPIEVTGNTFTMPGSAVTVTAVYAYTVTATSPDSGGTIAVSPSSAAAGDTVTVTLSPESGYELDAWNITGGITPTATGNPNVYTFTMPANDVTVSATFKSTGGSGGGGTNLVTNGDFSQGTTGWTSTANSFTVPDGTAHVTAGREDGKGIRQTITGLTVGNTYQVSFDVVSGKAKFIRDGETGIDVSAGTTYTTTFVASGNSTTLVFGGYEYVFTLDNVSLVDTAGGGGGGETTTYNVTAASGLSNGSLSVSPSTAAAGDTVTVTLSPESGYELDAWNITGGITPTATGNPNEYEFEMPANDVTVSATFKSTGGGTDPAGNLLDMTASAWSGSPSISGNKMTISSGDEGKTVSQSFTTIPNHTYTVTASVNNGSNGTLTFTVSGGGSGSQSIARWLSDHEALSIEFTATGTSTTLTIAKPSKGDSIITDLQVLAVPSNAASPFEDTGPGDDGPVLDLDGARSNMLGDGEGGVLVEGSPFTITASNSWELVIENLLSEEVINGEPVYYYYYVEEVGLASDTVDVDYLDNEGISGGDITIINTVSEQEPEYVLPETGGGGNWPYVVGGATLMTVCLFGGVVMTRRRRRASG